MQIWNFFGSNAHFTYFPAINYGYMGYERIKQIAIPSLLISQQDTFGPQNLNRKCPREFIVFPGSWHFSYSKEFCYFSCFKTLPVFKRFYRFSFIWTLLGFWTDVGLGPLRTERHRHSEAYEKFTPWKLYHPDDPPSMVKCCLAFGECQWGWWWPVMGWAARAGVIYCWQFRVQPY